MNVLMVVSWYTPMGSDKLEGGIFHYEQSMNLKENGCHMALYYPFDTQITVEETSEEEWGLLTYRSHYSTKGIQKNVKQMIKTMTRIVEEFKPDVIHAHCGTAAGFYSTFLSKKFGIPMVLTEHSPVEMSGVNHLGLSYLFSKIAYRHSKVNICVSEDCMRKLSKIYPRYKFDVIYNGIILPDKIEVGEYRVEGYINVGIVAMLYDLNVKGMQYLLPAIKMLKEQGKQVILHHIGGGEFLNHYKGLAEELGLSEQVVFHGACPKKQMYEIMNEMDFCVSASLVESAGVSVEEAMLLGKPILGTTSGGVESLVPKQAGIIVEKANVDALANGIMYMIEHLEDFNVNWIRQYAEDSFEMNHISQKYIEIYESVCN